MSYKEQELLKRGHDLALQGLSHIEKLQAQLATANRKLEVAMMALEQYSSVENDNTIGAMWSVKSGWQTPEGHKVYEACGTLKETAGIASAAIKTITEMGD